MSKAPGQFRTMQHEQPATRRQLRAARLRAQALSPVRIVMLLLSFPIMTIGVATSIYIRTSPYEPTDALAHLVARGGCAAASYVGLAPAYHGEIGYHALHDEDGNGVTCENDSQFASVPSVASASLSTSDPAPAAHERMVGGAKFLKP